MSANWPYFVGSRTSGVDGSSEGGRLSSTRLPTTLMVYALPLVQRLKQSGYGGKLTVEPAIVDGGWLLKLTYDGPVPTGVPEHWYGHKVVLKKAEEAPSEKKPGA